MRKSESAAELKPPINPRSSFGGKLNKIFLPTGYNSRPTTQDHQALSERSTNESSFVPFLNERDNLGRLITGKPHPRPKHTAYTMTNLNSQRSNSIIMQAAHEKSELDNSMRDKRARSLNKISALIEDNQNLDSISNIDLFMKTSNNRDTSHEKSEKQSYDPARITFENFILTRRALEPQKKISEDTERKIFRLHSLISQKNSGYKKPSYAFLANSRDSIEKLTKKDVDKIPGVGQYEVSNYNILRPKVAVAFIPKSSRSGSTGMLTGRNSVVETYEPKIEHKIENKEIPPLNFRHSVQGLNVPDFSKNTGRGKKSIKVNPIVAKVASQSIAQLEENFLFQNYLKFRYEHNDIHLPLNVDLKKENLPLTDRQIRDKEKVLRNGYKE